MKVKLIPVNNFGRSEFKPSNELGEKICEWLGKRHLSQRDKEYIKIIGLEPIVLEYGEVISSS